MLGATGLRGTMTPSFSELSSAALNDLRAGMTTRPLTLVSGTSGVLRGDLNGDGRVGAIDAQAVLTVVVGLTLPSTFKALPNGDANCNGTIQAFDAQLILAHVVGLSTTQFCVGTVQ
jgi:hypothetical protein